MIYRVQNELPMPYTSLFILVLLIPGIYSIYSISTSDEFNAFLLINIIFVIGYVITPIHIVLFSNIFINEARSSLLETIELGTISAAIVITVSYFLMVSGYQKTNWSANVNIDKINKLLLSNSTYILSILLILSVTSTYVYAQQYGGLLTTIRLTADIRSGTYSGGGDLVFLKYITKFSYVGLLFTFALLIRNTSLNNYRYNGIQSNLVLFILFLAISLIVMVISAGKREIIEVFVVLYLIYKLTKSEFSFKMFVLPVVFLAIILVIGDGIFYSMSSGEEVSYFQGYLQRLTERSPLLNIYAMIISNFAHMYLSLETAIQVHTIGNSRHILDWIYGLLSLIPERLFGVSIPNSVAYYNTELIRGEEKSIEQPGLIAYLWYAGHGVGILIGSFAFGAGAKFIDDRLFSLQFKPIGLMLYIQIVFIYSRFIIQGEPRVFIQSNFVWWVVFIGIIVWYQSSEKLDK